ncbi:PREDICTED: uncharacterized protein LOC108560701 [Nicrophorus vespilloides]|uniref:Uncharacterized protein LOC108560701 n=1 Tax=Nicrophorus vespilloides TaxID=110193 RepID=A0ABM1MH39_NICVS|nr:PREDICTED: uncharacterized protein LOC108560701 [Nicrophorus vespilloides]
MVMQCRILCAAFALCSAGNYHDGGYQSGNIFSSGILQQQNFGQYHQGGFRFVGNHGQSAQTYADSLGSDGSIQSHGVGIVLSEAIRRPNGLYTQIDFKNRQNGGHEIVQDQVVTVTKEVPVRIPQPYPITVTKQVKVGVPQPYPVHIPKPYPVPVQVKVPVHVPKPYPIKIIHQVPVRIPVYVNVPHPVKVEVPVPRPYPVEVVKHVQVKVPTPVYVKVPVPIHTHSHEIQTQTNYHAPVSSNFQVPQINANYQAGFEVQSSGFAGSYAKAEHGLNMQNFQTSYQTSGTFNGYIPSKQGGMYQNQGYNSYASGWKW